MVLSFPWYPTIKTRFDQSDLININSAKRINVFFVTAGFYCNSFIDADLHCKCSPRTYKKQPVTVSFDDNFVANDKITV